MDSQTLKSGEQFAGDFIIKKFLAAGGMGEVYIAEQQSTKKLRALKLMRLVFGGVDEDEARQRFKREARVSSKLRSKHIVEVIAAGVDGKLNIPWIAMEFLDGEDLETYAKRQKSLSLKEVHYIFDQLCDAVGDAHQNGIVHRDLKPDNIFLEKKTKKQAREEFPYTVKVLDFGIAKIIAQSKPGGFESGESPIVSRVGMGTPIWMAPEQIFGDEITSSTDVWALGLIAFRLLVGVPYWPKPEKTPDVIKEIVEQKTYPTASKRSIELGYPSQLPDRFDSWFSRCVVKDQAKRYQDARQAYDALSKLGDHDNGPPPPDPPTPEPKPILVTIPIPLMRRRTRHSNLKIAVFVAFVLFGIVAFLIIYILLTKPSSGQDETHNPQLANSNSSENLDGSSPGTRPKPIASPVPSSPGAATLATPNTGAPALPPIPVTPTPPSSAPRKFECLKVNSRCDADWKCCTQSCKSRRCTPTPSSPTPPESPSPSSTPTESPSPSSTPPESTN